MTNIDVVRMRPGFVRDLADLYTHLRAAILAAGGKLELTGAQVQDAERHGLTVHFDHETGGVTLELTP